MSSDDNAREVILEQAAHWYAMHRAGELLPAERIAFRAWLQRSPAHIEEYFGVAAAAHQLAAEAQASDDDVSEFDADEPALAQNACSAFSHDAIRTNDLHGIRAERKRSPQLLLAACVTLFTLALLAYGFRETLQFGFGETYRTVQGQQGSWRLSDGSVLTLNSNSAVTVRLNQGERWVKVHHGQVRFQVSHEPMRRFRVTSEDAAVVAIGTQFDVYRLADATQVTIIDGRVTVSRKQEAGSEVALSAGQQVLVSPASISQPRAVDIDDASAWIQRRIVFEQVPLRQVVMEFNRYSTIPLRVEGAQLNELKITGSFGAYDLESFLAFMRSLGEVAVEPQPGEIVLRSSSARH